MLNAHGRQRIGLKKRLAKDRGSEDIDFDRAEAALKRAIVRIRVAEKKV